MGDADNQSGFLHRYGVIRERLCDLARQYGRFGEVVVPLTRRRESALSCFSGFEWLLLSQVLEMIPFALDASIQRSLASTQEILARFRETRPDMISVHRAERLVNPLVI